MSAAKGSRPVKPGKGKNALVVLLTFTGVCLIIFGLLAVSVRLFIPGIVTAALGALSVFGAVHTRTAGKTQVEEKPKRDKSLKGDRARGVHQRRRR